MNARLVLRELAWMLLCAVVALGCIAALHVVAAVLGGG